MDLLTLNAVSLLHARVSSQLLTFSMLCIILIEISVAAIAM